MLAAPECSLRVADYRPSVGVQHAWWSAVRLAAHTDETMMLQDMGALPGQGSP